MMPPDCGGAVIFGDLDEDVFQNLAGSPGNCRIGDAGSGL